MSLFAQTSKECEFFGDQLPNIKRYVRTVGSELEGAFNPIRGLTIVSDGSVEVAGNNDDCECYQDCDCVQCERCTRCGESCDNCTCDSCRVCTSCGEVLDECICIVEPTPNCTECVRAEGACDDCYNSWRDNNMNWNCYQTDHSERDCNPQDCGCCTCSNSNLEDGERVSPVLAVQDLPQWVLDNYPDEVNDTCGAHLHVGVDMLTYSILMDSKFTDFVISESKAWRDRANIHNASFDRRLNNTNHYCKVQHDAGNQVWQTEHYYGARYTTVNYCYRLHGTIEFRIPPAFKQARITAKYYCLLLSLIPKFVKNYKTESYIGTIQ